MVKKIIQLMFPEQEIDLTQFIEHMERRGQDVRYSIDDTKLLNLGWKPQADFDTELANIVEYYKKNFIW